MDEKKDIETREDLEHMLAMFYKKAFEDDLISRFFIEVVPLNLEQHLPVITDFWESVLLNAKGYRKNVMDIHAHIHSISPIKKVHLDRWLKLFTGTVDELFEGSKATLAKQRAISIATLMDIKLNHSDQIKKL